MPALPHCPGASPSRLRWLFLSLCWIVAVPSPTDGSQDPIEGGLSPGVVVGNGRRPPDDVDLRDWLNNMVTHHRFTPDEAALAMDMTAAEVRQALRRFEIPETADSSVPSDPAAPLSVLPYPGGRHPRLGFFDGAIAPQRETKASVFLPWDRTAYVVVDVPEAIFSNLGLTYLAHTHIPTIWDPQGIRLPTLEWRRTGSGTLVMERSLPNGIAFGSEVSSQTNGVRFRLWLRNGTTNALSGLRVQNCVMLGRAPEFAPQTLTNKVFSAPFAAVKSRHGQRWVITAWQHCGRAWGNEQVPCLHSDPVFPDCAPAQTVQVKGWLSFFEGAAVQPEFERLRRAGVIE
ncbi:MAG: hypothetical protein JNK85_17205 [Verrucomicrobiales bacterium]|nr:hypothetical protein [Verrucomicrobiales bacterium]